MVGADDPDPAPLRGEDLWGRTVLRDLQMDVKPGARLGLVGGNGAGKSTLLRILAGVEEVDGGEVNRRRGASDAYLSKHAEGDGGMPR